MTSSGALGRGTAFALLVIAAGFSGCEQRPGRASAVSHPSVTASTPGEATAPAGKGTTRLVSFQGACDASGAVPLSGGRFLVADDEDNVLRVYDARKGGAALTALDLSPELELERRKKPESDIEAATLLGDAAFFLTSHGRTKKGKVDPDRSLLFATTLPEKGASPALVGKPYRRLLDDLSSEPRLAAFELAKAAELAPKEPGGLNLEGLTAAPDGTLLIGLRSPTPKGRALLVPLTNPREILDGARARFGEPLLFDLGGLGVRSLTYFRSSFLVAAGPSGEGGPFRLYRFEPGASPSLVPGVDFADLVPEGFVSAESDAELLVLSDDGNRVVDGKPCKKLRDPSAKSFRGLWLDLPQEPARGPLP